MWRDLCTSIQRLIAMCHVLCLSVTWLIDCIIRHVTHSNVTSPLNLRCCDAFICNQTHSYVPWLIRHVWLSHVTYEWVTSHIIESRHIWMNHVTYAWVTWHLNKSRHIWMGNAALPPPPLPPLSISFSLSLSRALSLSLSNITQIHWRYAFTYSHVR